MSKINFNNIKFEASYGTSSQLPYSKKQEIAFVGKSNVGKSSLINKLCNNNKIAKVSAQPGKTTTINFFKLNDFYFVDLPGYGYAKRSKQEKQRWQELIEGYFVQNRMFSLIVILLDIRHNPTELDINMINYICELGLPFVIVLTKADKLSKQKINNAKNNINKLINPNDHMQIIACSSYNGQGIQELKNLISLVLQ